MKAAAAEHYYLEPGYIYRAPADTIIHTVVGNSVCVCLWDRRNRQGAMNHFRFPAVREAAKATAIYGNVATAHLVRLMLDAGASPYDLAAQIFGGAAHRAHGDPELGACNQAIAKAVLQRKGIAIHSEDTGGHMGRKVAFDTATGHVIVLKVHDLRATDWGTVL